LYVSPGKREKGAGLGETATGVTAATAVAPDVSGRPAGGPAVVLRGLRKRYGQLAAVDGVDLDIAAGEFFTMLGPSGSGKTTLLRMIAGLSAPSQGELTVATTRDRVGLVTHEPLVYGQLTAAENLALFARLYRVPRARVGELLVRFELAGVRDERASSFSRGMLQRLSLCRALLHDPALLVLDEPFNALDAEGVALLEEELRSHAERTVVAATHEPERLEALASERIVLG
jgi:heme exporter protein A